MKDEQRKDSGFDQAALGKAAWRGFANGAFDDLGEDVPGVVEEFYPDAPATDAERAAAKVATVGLRGRL